MPSFGEERWWVGKDQPATVKSQQSSSALPVVALERGTGAHHGAPSHTVPEALARSLGSLWRATPGGRTPEAHSQGACVPTCGESEGGRRRRVEAAGGGIRSEDVDVPYRIQGVRRVPISPKVKLGVVCLSAAALFLSVPVRARAWALPMRPTRPLRQSLPSFALIHAGSALRLAESLTVHHVLPSAGRGAERRRCTVQILWESMRMAEARDGA